MVKFNCISRNNKKQEVSKSHVLNSTTAKGNIDVGEKSSKWLEQRIVEALHNRHPEFSRQPEWNEPKTNKWCEKPNKKEAYHPTRQTIDKR